MRADVLHHVRTRFALLILLGLLGCGGGGGGSPSDSIAESANSTSSSSSSGNTLSVTPEAPTRLGAQAGNGTVVLSWQISTNALSYIVKRSTTAGGPYASIGSAASPTFTDTGCANGTTCYYVVTAVNGARESAHSNEISALPTAGTPPPVTPPPAASTPPGAPAGLQAVAGAAQAALSWASTANATAYRLKRATKAGGPYTQLIQTAAISHTDLGLSNGTTYYYVVSALNTAGESANSAEVTAKPMAISVTPTAPGAPAGLTATAQDAQVSLSWAASASTTGYKLKRGTVTGGPYVQIATPATPAFLDTGRINGTTYYYVVSATNAAGDSADSSEVAATPKAAAPVTSLPTLPESNPARNSLGMNTWFLNDWDESFAFVDAMKHARPWQDAADWHNPVAGIDALGWPTADASTVIFTGTPAQVNGTYKLVFTGQATVKLMWAGGSVSNQSYNAATNTTTADVTFNISARGSSGLVFTNTKRTATSAANTGFTHARLYRPGYPGDGSKVFTTAFLNALGKAGTLRLMDWTATNQNLTQRWSDRITPLHMSKPGPSYTGPGGASWATSQTGVALEHQIQLCNAAHQDCWINIPVVANDDYVRKLALSLRYGTDGTTPYTSPQSNPAYPPLDADLRVYLEYANEIWNSAGGFQCFSVIQDIASALPANHPLLTPAEPSIWYRMWRYPAYRLAGISDIFRSVYGDASMMNRVRPVLMTQQGNAQSTLEQSLNWLDAYARRQTPSRTVSSFLYGAGGSGYYGVNTEPADKTNANAFFAAGNYPATQNVKGFGVDSVWSANFGLKHIAYEGGPSLDNFNDTQSQAINADFRMQDMMVKTHDAWSAQGGDLLVYYTVVGPGSWEFTPDITTTNTPKLNALTQLQTRARAAVTLGGALPGTLIATDLIAHRIRSGTDYTTTCDGVPCLGGNDAGEWMALPAHASTAFTGALSVNGIASTPTVLNVWINGENKGPITLAGNSHLANSSSLSVAIPAGLVVIRLEVVSGGINLRSISVN